MAKMECFLRHSFRRYHRLFLNEIPSPCVIDGAQVKGQGDDDS